MVASETGKNTASCFLDFLSSFSWNFIWFLDFLKDIHLTDKEVKIEEKAAEAVERPPEPKVRASGVVKGLMLRVGIEG